MQQPEETTPQTDQLPTIHQNGLIASIYPMIGTIENAKRQFLCTESIPNKYKTIRTSDNRIHRYFAAVLKILSPFCKELKLRDLWVCEKQVTTYPILVYFTEPLWYPVMDCCGKCLFIEFQQYLSGSAKCTSCKKVGFSFVNIGNGHRAKSSKRRSSKTQISQHKQNNYLADQRMETQKQNQKIYKQYKQRNQHRKAQIRKLISSNQHRHQSIKKAIGLANTSLNIPSKINNSGDENPQFEIGQFIIEIDGAQRKNQRFKGMRPQSSNKMENYQRKTINNEQIDKTKIQQHSLPETETCREIRSIIESIFF